MIICKTPMRVSLFGGGTDYPSYYDKHGGAVLGMAIDKYVWVTLRPLPPFFEHRFRIVYSKIELVREVAEIVHPAVRGILQYWKMAAGLEIHHDADLPARSGMGSSSAFTVGLLNALYALHGRMVTKKVLADTAIHVEQNVLGENVGSQDQIWAAYGGLNRIEFLDSTYSVHPVVLTAERRAELTESMALYYTGHSRLASEVSAEQFARVEANMDQLHALKALTDEAAAILTGPTQLRYLGYLLNDAWAIKKSLSPAISSSAIDELHEAGRRAGAWGAKLLGAGSGGFMLFLVPPDRRTALREAMKGRIEIAVQPDHDGSKVVVYQPDGF